LLNLTLKEIRVGPIVVGQITQFDVVVRVQHLGRKSTVYSRRQRLVGNG